jgi:hypothetical protein
VPIAFGSFVFASYHLATLPFLSPFGQSLWLGFFASLLLSGLVAVAYASPGGPRFRILACAVYAISMVATLLFVGFWGACMNGDCL